MNYRLKMIGIVCVSLLMLWKISTQNVIAETPTAAEWIDVEVVVNVLDGADANNIDEAINNANDAFKQAKIRLVKKATDPNATADTDSSGALTRNERDEARREGQDVLERTLGAGKGVKIDIGTNINESDANTVGFAIHRNPVILVEPNADVNELGNTIAHELGHVFTLNYDLYDVNDQNRLMYGYTGGGTHLDADEIAEIRRGAKRRGRSYIVNPGVLPGQSSVMPAGFDHSLDARGAILDNFSDIELFGAAFDANNARLQFADLREICVFADEPNDTNCTLNIDIHLGPGPYGDTIVDSFFDVYFDISPQDRLGGVQLQLMQDEVVYAKWWNDSGETDVPVDVIVQRNNEFTDPGQDPNFHNRSIHVEVPVELVALQLKSVQPIHVFAQTWQNVQLEPSNPSSPFFSIWDDTLPFEFKIDMFNECPGLTFFSSESIVSGLPNLGVSGCGFTPGGVVDIQLDGQSVAQTDTLDDGSFTISDINVPTGLQIHSVVAREVNDDIERGGAVWAPGFFVINQEGLRTD